MDASLFHYQKQSIVIYLPVYVDNIVITGSLVKVVEWLIITVRQYLLLKIWETWDSSWVLLSLEQAHSYIVLNDIIS